MSQSLWNRAVSSDGESLDLFPPQEVSIPLEQGSVFRPSKLMDVQDLYLVSIPLEQGSVFRLYFWLIIFLFLFNVSIPLEQGSVFRLLVS